MKRRLIILGVVLTVVSSAGTLGAIWWWALAGMSENVVEAWMATLTLTACGAAAAIGFAADMEDAP